MPIPVHPLLATLLLLAVQCLVFVVASILYSPQVTNNPGSVSALLSYSAMVSPSPLPGTACFVLHTSFALFSGIGSIMCLISGLSFPLSLLPQSIQTMVRVLPTYYLAHGLLMLGKQSGSGVLLSAVVLWEFTGIFLLIGSKRRF
jgi:ABC-2 type transport system permease protein